MRIQGTARSLPKIISYPPDLRFLFYISVVNLIVRARSPNIKIIKLEGNRAQDYNQISNH